MRIIRLATVMCVLSDQSFFTAAIVKQLHEKHQAWWFSHFSWRPMSAVDGALVAMQMILTVRDPDKWYESYVASLLWLYRTWWFKPFSWCLSMGWKLQVNTSACIHILKRMAHASRCLSQPVNRILP